MRLDILNALDSKAILKELNAPSSKSVAASALEKLKIPNKKTEKYRYFDIEPIVQKDWDIAETKQEEIQKSGKKIIIKDGALINSSDVDGVEVELIDFSDFDNDHFDALYYLSHLLTQKVIAVRVSKDAKFEIEHQFTQKEKLINYRVAIFVDANTHAQVYESFNSEAENCLILSGYDIFLTRDSSLKFIKSNTLLEQSYTPIFSNYFKIEQNANLKLSTFDFNKDNALYIFKAELSQDANIDASHLLYSDGKVKSGVVSEIVHIGKSSTSNQKLKSILDNDAKGIFDALIRVTNSAKYTKAHQNSKAILLHSGAYMASKPQLEIYIDDLEASHGSTTGQLDEDALFYLRSRGIKKEDAKKMLILAFANEVIKSVDDEYLANKIYNQFEVAYYGKYELDCMKTCDSCEEMVLGENDENS